MKTGGSADARGPSTVTPVLATMPVAPAPEARLPVPATLPPEIGRQLAAGWLVSALVVLFLLALGTRSIGLGGAVTEDEDQWIARSGTFARGLTAGDWRRTYLTGHPGVTVMWLTSLTLGSARTVPFERGTNAPDVTTVPDFLPALHRARVPFAVVQAGLVVVVVVLAARLLGPGTGFVAGLLLAAEPFWAGVGPVVGMDGLLSGFLTVSLLALLLAVALGTLAPGAEAPGSATGGSVRARLAWAALAGSVFGLAFLTKTTALFLGPVVLALVLLFGWQAWRERRIKADTRSSAGAAALQEAISSPGAAGAAVASQRAAGAAVSPDAAGVAVASQRGVMRWWAAPLLLAGVLGAAAILVVWVVWPAAWLTPLDTFWRTVTFSANLGGTPHGSVNYLLGVPSSDPGAWFYPVALLVRLGPGTIIGLLLLFVFGAQHPALRIVWPLLGYVLLFLLLLTLAAKKVDRYLLPILPTLGIMAAVGWMEGARRLCAFMQHRRTVNNSPSPACGRGGRGVRGFALSVVGVVAFGLQVWPLVLAGPYPLAGYNPLVGGVQMAEYAIPVGWGDGLDVAGARIRELAGPRVVVTAIWSPLRVNFGAHAPGPVVSERQLAQADFFVDYINARQRGMTPRTLVDRQPDATVTIGGVDYARIYRLR